MFVIKTFQMENFFQMNKMEFLIMVFVFFVFFFFLLFIFSNKNPFDFRTVWIGVQQQQQQENIFDLYAILVTVFGAVCFTLFNINLDN